MRVTRDSSHNALTPPTVSAVQVLLLRAHAAAAGFDLLPLLARLGFDSSALAATDAHVDAARYVQLLLATDAACGRGDFWFTLGRTYTLPTHGALGLAIQSCANAREALPLICRYHPTIGAGTRLSHTRTRAGAGVLQIDVPNPAAAAESRIRTELLLGVIKSGLERLLGEPVTTLQFEIAYAAPAHAAAYRLHLGQRVLFGAAASRMIVPRTLLERSFPDANAVVGQLYAEQCERRLRALQRGSDVVMRVEQAIAALGTPAPALADVAQQLATTPRTLSRRLTERGVSYRLLQQRLRLERARQYLAEGQLAVKEIAALLGFDSPSSFSRAFVAWAGISPTAFRRGTPD